MTVRLVVGLLIVLLGRRKNYRAPACEFEFVQNYLEQKYLWRIPILQRFTPQGHAILFCGENVRAWQKDNETPMMISNRRK